MVNRNKKLIYIQTVASLYKIYYKVSFEDKANYLMEYTEHSYYL